MLSKTDKIKSYMVIYHELWSQIVTIYGGKKVLMVNNEMIWLHIEY